MSADDFRELYIKLVESYGIESESAQLILQRIISIFDESSGEKQEK